MQGALEFAKGPLFIMTLTFMILGLGRHVFLQVVQFQRSIQKLTHRDFHTGRTLRSLLEWMIPVGHIYRNRPLISIISFVFHCGILLTPLFFLGHIDLIRRSLGISWPGFPMLVADILTVIASIAALILISYRLFNRGARALSSPGDYLILVFIFAPFLSGFMAFHPALNPLPYNDMLLVHILSSECLFVLLPTTKLAHCVLFPFDRFSSEVYWHMPAGAGDRVARDLHGEEARV